MLLAFIILRAKGKIWISSQKSKWKRWSSSWVFRPQSKKCFRKAWMHYNWILKNHYMKWPLILFLCCARIIFPIWRKLLTNNRSANAEIKNVSLEEKIISLLIISEEGLNQAPEAFGRLTLQLWISSICWLKRHTDGIAETRVSEWTGKKTGKR